MSVAAICTTPHSVTPDTAVDAEKKSVDLTYVFQKGNLVTIEKIEMVGNSKTRDKVIRREMRINEGDLYSGTGVRISKQRITALGFFDNVEINNRRGSGDNKMILEVSIKEKLVQQIVEPVRWEQTMQALISEAPAGRFIELAPGRTLAGLAKRINRRLPVESVEA